MVGSSIMAQEVRNIRRQKLPNGLTIITEQMQLIRSASIGVWLQTGSRDEDAQWNGISHFIEHMVFKGTKSRTAEEIARQVDSIGGEMEAFTPQERKFVHAENGAAQMRHLRLISAQRWSEP